ncbi:MAG: hypothetical protein HOD63_07705 [Bacteroidetes bacterium]|mgnify:FL=1|jgi:hypothetical protein|nr:hypothetical protein [Bacteroidota bacterium]MBT7995279.1 hypothetical protein [Bacteroidota bacterium]
MRKYLKRIAIFQIPCIIYLLLIVVIDPYNYFPATENIVNSALKKEISYKYNYRLYKLLEFEKHPTSVIILGDSRANNLNDNVIRKYSKNDYSNLSYGGGTIQEAIQTFWTVIEKVDLKEVYWGVNFNNYHNSFDMDKVSESIVLKNNFLAYAFSKYTIKSSFLILKSLVFKSTPSLDKPSVSIEDYWVYMLDDLSDKYYSAYAYPQIYYEELQRISEYCENNNIRLVFFISPTYIGFQRKVKEYNLQIEESNFKRDLQNLGDLFDFDFPSEITLNKENFIDPMHFNPEVSILITKEIFTSEIKYSHYSKMDIICKSKN